MACWVASVHVAIDTLKQRSNVQQVALVGLRLGATLAAIAAAARTDVCGVVAIAPVVQGRLYLRELRILAETAAVGGDASADSNIGLESAGFLLTKEATETISALDLRTAKERPAANVLIVNRDDLPSQPHWENALTALDANVQTANWPGYKDMAIDPQRSVVPEFLINGVVNSLRTWCSDPGAPRLVVGGPVEGARQFVEQAFATASFHEKPVQIELGGSSLFGLLTTPAAGETSATAVLLLNSGSVHSIGPNRLWVRLARSWAARGMVVLRLDLSGIGDSLPRPGSGENVVYSAEAAHDIASAIRYLQDHLGATDCRLLGLCSGAYHGFKAAVNGVPVTSAVLINPLTFFWEIGKPLNDGIKDYEVVTQSSNYRRQLFSLEPWRKLLSGQLDMCYLFSYAKRRLAFLVRPGAEVMARWLRIPLKEDLARELDAAASTGVQHFVFAVGEPGIELLKNQGQRSLDRLVSRKRITVDYVPDADHTFTRLDARDRLVKVLDHLMFGAGVIA